MGMAAVCPGLAAPPTGFRAINCVKLPDPILGLTPIKVLGARMVGILAVLVAAMI